MRVQDIPPLYILPVWKIVLSYVYYLPKVWVKNALYAKKQPRQIDDRDCFYYAVNFNQVASMPAARSEANSSLSVVPTSSGVGVLSTSATAAAGVIVPAGPVAPVAPVAPVGPVTP